MKSTKSIVAATAALGILAAFALAAQGGSFKDKAGNMEIRQIKSWRIQPEGKGKLRFIGSGSPKLKGSWREQGLTVETATLNALATADAKNAYKLDTAVMGGGVTITRNGAKSASGVPSGTVRSATATYTAAESKVDADGGVTIDSNDPATSQVVHATGSSGTIYLSGGAGKAGMIGKAILNGPVTMSMNAERLAEVNGVQKRVPYTVKGSGDHLEYDAGARTIVLKGHVKLSGDDPVLSGAEVEASNATLKLTATGEIESIDFDGDPGRTVVTDGSRAGGGRR